MSEDKCDYIDYLNEDGEFNEDYSKQVFIKNYYDTYNVTLDFLEEAYYDNSLVIKLHEYMESEIERTLNDKENYP